MGVATWRRVVGVPAVLTLLGACSFDGTHEGAGYRCDVDGDCPVGTVCLDGTCRPQGSAGGDAGGGEGDAGRDNGDGAASDSIIDRACPGAILDQDDFAFESSTRWYWFVNGDGDIVAVGGVARARLFATNARAGLVSTGTYPLTGTAFAIGMAAPAPADNTYASFELVTEDGETPLLSIYREGDRIVAERTEPGMSGQIVEESLYNPIDHAIWRIRHQGDSVTWETSSDALSWTALVTESPSASLPDSVLLRVVTETDATSDAYQQLFDDVVVCDLP